MTVGQLAALLATLDQTYPVCVTAHGVTVELAAAVQDDWYVPADPLGVVYLGPHCLLHALHPESKC